MCKVPRRYTTCEAYRGYTIAVNAGEGYVSFTPDSRDPCTRGARSRADCRRAIDAHILASLVVA